MASRRWPAWQSIARCTPRSPRVTAMCAATRQARTPPAFAAPLRTNCRARGVAPGAVVLRPHLADAGMTGLFPRARAALGELTAHRRECARLWGDATPSMLAEPTEYVRAVRDFLDEP